MHPTLQKHVGAGALILLALPAHAHIGETQKLTASDGLAGDRFGSAVAVDSSHAVIGAPVASGTGAVYVFELVNQLYVEVAKLTPSDGAAGDRFGSSVDLSGDTLVVGALQHDASGADAGAVYVFVRSGTVWSEQAKLLASDGAPGHLFGGSVSVSDDQLVAGAKGADGFTAGAGAAYVFGRTGTAWSEEAKLMALDGDAGDEFGSAVGIDEGLICVGAPKDGDLQLAGGAAYVFEEIVTGAWSQDAKVTATVPAAEDTFGASVSVHHEEGIAIGCPGDDDVAANAGSVFVFEEDLTADHGWVLKIHLLPTLATPGAECGRDVAIHHGSVLGGAPMELGAQGYTYFWAAEEAYEEDQLEGEDAEAGDHFGSATDAWNCFAITGSPLDDGKGEALVDAGSAYFHLLKHPQELYCTAGVSASGCTPSIGAVGLPSASLTGGFTLFAQGVEGAKDGLFFTGVNGRQANQWGSGTSFQCVVPPVVRGSLRIGIGTSGQCDGGFQEDWNAIWATKPLKNPGAGATVQAQCWYRDPLNTSNRTTSLTNAIEFELCP